MRRWLLAIGLALAWTPACGADVASPVAPGTDGVAVLIGAGDIGVCGSVGAEATGRLIDAQPGTVVAVGDLAYPHGTTEQFQACYDPVWGRARVRTRPAPGNHEYESPGAGPYFGYFGFSAGPPGLGYYRYRLGGWPVYSLNSSRADAMQVQWLVDELERQTERCVLAYFHHPLFSSGPHGLHPPAPMVRDLWHALYAAGADVVISAHEHLYERFSPQTPEGRADPQFGIRQFIVGTGGAPLSQLVRRSAHSDVVLSTHGVLRLTLEPDGYRWEFLSAPGGAVLDAGTGRCHGKPPAG